jgi:hypothetical protein
MKRFAKTFAAACFATALLCAPAKAAEYGLESLSASLSTTQAGAHPDFTTVFEMNRESNGAPVAPTREIEVKLPPGLLANPNAAPKCTVAQLVLTDIGDPSNENTCPQDSQVGVSEVAIFEPGIGELRFNEPVYNMAAPGGDVVARLGLFAYVAPAFIDAEVRSEDDYGVTATLKGLNAFIPFISAETTLWGVPADESHDAERITPYEAVHCSGAPCTPDGKRKSGLTPVPFMVNPTRCGAPLELGVTARSYVDPTQPASATAPFPAITGCGKIGFAPSLEVRPTSREAGAPTGLEATFTLPQDESVGGLATSHLKDAVVTLPKGLTIASGAADGLTACSAAQVAYKTRTASHCPDAAKIGSAEFDVPALAETLHGSVYQRTPEPGNLFRIWLVADDLGAHVKLPGEIKVDPKSGQITSLFLDNPQVPLRGLTLRFKEGSRAPLANPDTCATYTTHYEFTPHSGAATVSGDSAMRVDQGCGSGGFSPRLDAGATNPAAGSFSSFLTRLTRADGEENVAALEVTPPQGLLAKLAGVAVCSEPGAQAGACPASSQVGRVTVASGPGTTPLWIPQPGKTPTAIYLSGPYKGAPYSLVVTVPAQAGPFDLGTVVSRAAIHVDPRTAQVSVTSDPLPQILEGVPVTYRTIDVAVDRPEFTLNPTSCTEMAVKATVTSDKGTLAHPSDRFRVGGCRGLGFSPKLALRLFGKANRGAYQRLRATLTARPGDANIASAAVTLPHSAFLAQNHIRTVCTRAQFAQDRCPEGSIYGRAKATSPLLDYPVQGPVYLRSSSNPLPDLVAALRGPDAHPVKIELSGRTDSFKGALRNSFDLVPDAPVEKFTLELFGGKRALIVNSTNVCAETQRATVRLKAQNGERLTLRPPLQSACAKAAKKPNKRHR